MPSISVLRIIRTIQGQEDDWLGQFIEIIPSPVPSFKSHRFCNRSTCPTYTTEYVVFVHSRRNVTFCLKCGAAAMAKAIGGKSRVVP